MILFSYAFGAECYPHFWYNSSRPVIKLQLQDLFFKWHQLKRNVMKKFLSSILPIEKVAFVGVAFGAIILIGMGFFYPTVGIAVLFMLGTLTLFWSVLTVISTLTRLSVARKAEKRRLAEENFDNEHLTDII